MDKPAPRPALWKKAAAAFTVSLIAFAAGYVGWVAYRSAHLYVQLKSAGRGWETPVNTYDAVLGYAPIPNSQSVELFSCGYRVPVRHDAEGCRIPADESAPPERRPLILAFGCSFTYGTGVPAEQAFPYRVALELGGAARNAGVAGYGLGQMLLRARSLIPQHRPDYVLMQYAPWIVARSLDYASASEAYGRMPRPYFALDTAGSFFVAPPAFATNYFDLNMSPYVEGRAGILESASFVWRVGLPLWTFSDAQATLFAAKRALGLLPPLAPGSGDLVRWAYTEVGGLCRANGSKLVVVVLGSGGIPPSEMPPSHMEALRSVEGAIVVDAYAALYERLEHPTPGDYERAYGIWACTPPRLIDRHPNDRAHAVIADAIVGALRPAARPGS